MLAPVASQSLIWVIAAFFLIGAAINTFAPASIRADYARWGYPKWFHYVTAALESGVVILLLFPAARFAGAVLGALVLLAAAGTTLAHREYGRAVAPTIALLLTVTLAWSMQP